MIENTRKILAVDDESINQLFLKNAFKHLNVPADIAKTGQEVLDRIAKEHGTYAVVILDIGLPDINGKEVAKKIRMMEKEQNLPAVFISALTGNVDPGHDAECYAAGMNDFVAKPVDIEKMKALLQRAGVLN